VKINTVRLDIRSWTIDDAPAFFVAKPGSRLHFFSRSQITNKRSVESAREWIQSHPEKYGVWLKESGELIGMGGLTQWKWEGEELVDITYRLKTSAHGKGYGWELAQALVDYGFKSMGLTQITATITPDNLASKKIAHKLGMKFDRRIELLGVATDLYRLDSP